MPGCLGIICTAAVPLFGSVLMFLSGWLYRLEAGRGKVLLSGAPPLCTVICTADPDPGAEVGPGLSVTLGIVPVSDVRARVRLENSLEPAIPGGSTGAGPAWGLEEVMVTQLSDTGASLSLAGPEVHEVTRLSAASVLGNTFFRSRPIFTLVEEIFAVELSHWDLGSGIFCSMYSCFTVTSGVCRGPVTICGSRCL